MCVEIKTRLYVRVRVAFVTFLPWVALAVWGLDAAWGCQVLLFFVFPFLVRWHSLSFGAFQAEILLAWTHSPGNSQLPINLAQLWQRRGSRKRDMKSVRDGRGVRERDRAAFIFSSEVCLREFSVVRILPVTTMSDDCTTSWRQCNLKNPGCTFCLLIMQVAIWKRSVYLTLTTSALCGHHGTGPLALWITMATSIILQIIFSSVCLHFFENLEPKMAPNYIYIT